MTKIDISKIKPRDQVQVANGDWYEFAGLDQPWGCALLKYNEACSWPVPCALITAHKPAAAPEPVEWVTVESYRNWVYNPNLSEFVPWLNNYLTAKYGPPPGIKTATGGGGG